MKNLIALGILALAFGFCMSIAAAEDAIVTTDNSSDNLVIAPAPEDASAVKSTDENASAAEGTEITPAEVQDITAAFPESAGDPGVTPDSPIMYGLDRAMERISLALTLGKSAKAQKGLAHARERLLEVRAMILAKKAKQAEKAREKYEEKLNEVRDAVEELEEDGSQSAILGNIKENLKMQAGIENQAMAIEALKAILNEQNLTESQRTALEALVAKMESKATDLQEKTNQKQSKIKDRLRAVTGKNESEVEELVGNMTSEAGLDNARKMQAERWIARTESSLQKISEKLQSEKMKGMNVSELGELNTYLAEVNKKLADAKDAYANGSYKEALEILKPVNNYGRQLNQVVKVRNAAKLAALKEVRDKELGKIKEVKEKLEQNREKVASRIKSSIAAGIQAAATASGKAQNSKNNK